MRSSRIGLAQRRAVHPIFAMIGALGLSACATAPYGGAERLDVPVATRSAAGFELRTPDVLAGPRGLRVHGALCRRLSWARAPHRLRLDLVDPGGEILSQWVRALHSVPKSHRQCVFYDIPTAWILKPGQSLHLSAE